MTVLESLFAVAGIFVTVVGVIIFLIVITRGAE